jgi:uncharacterized protein YndB with AHSA1/START domain
MAIGGKDDSRIAFTANRKLEFPRERVWDTYTNPALLQHWWGPKGSTIISCTGVLRPGGMFLYGLALPDGGELWGRNLYREVHHPMQLVYVASYTDTRGYPVRNPANRNWPIEVLTTVNFGKAGAGTAFSIRAMPQNATDAEKAAYEDEHFNLRDAINESLERLEHFLARTAPKPSAQ